MKTLSKQLALLALLTIVYSCGGPKPESDLIWVGTWASAQQLVEPRNMPPEPGLSNNTLRQVLRVSIAGEELRIKFSNEFSSNPLTLKKVHLALSKGYASIDTSSSVELKFNGDSEVTMDPGTAIYSDPFSFDLKARSDLAITIYFGQTSADVTGHPGSRTTSFIQSGDATSHPDLTGSVKTDHWYTIAGIDVKAPKTAAAIAILGNSITDGRGSGSNKQNRWPDILSEQLLANPNTKQLGVLNMGIGGNCVLKNCLGPSALDRFESDVLNQQGVKWLIILEGVNDLGQTQDSTHAINVARELISAFEGMIEEAHANGILVYGATILPFGKSFYYRDFRDAARNTFNEWMRDYHAFDAVIDFDKIMRNPEDTISMLPDAHDGDFLHPNEKGYRIMGEAVDLALFE